MKVRLRACKLANVCQNELREPVPDRVHWRTLRPEGPGVRALRAGTCLQARSRDVTPSSWKQSAATGVVARKRSSVFTARHSDSKERPNWRCTGISQLSSLQRDSAVTYPEEGEA